VTTIGASGRDPEDVTLDLVREGSVSMPDLSIHPATLAEQHDNPQLAANFRRAAELTALGDGEILALYEALRPHRSTAAELSAHAQRLEERHAVINAALFREAAEVYARRGLLRR
jgi:propanediol dehydratase small subunit